MSCGLFRLKNKPNDFTYLYQDKNIGVNELIHTDGVYVSNTSNTKEYIVLFEDGLICSPDVYPTKDNITTTYPKEINDRHIWGTYIVENDTIKSQIIVDLGLDGGVGASRSFFLILNSKQIKKIGYISDHGEYFEENIIYNYEPLTDRMDSADCWLFKKKWFWTEEAWNRHVLFK